MTIDLAPATPRDLPDIDLLLDAAFEPARRARTAYRLREGVAPIDGLSLVARERGRLVGSIQYWPVELVCDRTRRLTQLTLLGPVAVAPDLQGAGLGRRLIRESLALAKSAGHRAIMLIGDPGYYARFGFASELTGGWRLPGAVELDRLLVRVADGVLLPDRGGVRAVETFAAAA